MGRRLPQIIIFLFSIMIICAYPYPKSNFLYNQVTETKSVSGWLEGFFLTLTLTLTLFFYGYY